MDRDVLMLNLTSLPKTRIAPRDSFKSVHLFLPVLSALPKEEPVPEVVLLVSVSAVSVSHLVILAFSLLFQWMSVFVW